MRNGIKILGITLLLWPCAHALAADSVDYSKTMSASDASEWFFGKATPSEERKRMALNIGRISLKAQTHLQCGKLSLSGNIEAEIGRMEKQLSAASIEIRNMLTDPEKLKGVLVATVCYYKPNICAHMRHFSVLLQEEINLQMDACRALDNFIDEQANKGEKMLRAEAVNQCINNNKDKMGPSQMKACLESKGTARNLLRPFSKELATGKQSVLSSILKSVKQLDDYDVWSQIMGEVELHENGYWAKAFPNDLLSPDDYIENVIHTARDSSCDTGRLREIIRSTGSDSQSDPFSRYVRKHIRSSITMSAVDDLESLPVQEKNMACQALGLSIAKASIEDFTSSGRSSITAALSNDALPEDLVEFYQERSEMSFSALNERLKAREIRPLKDVLERIGRLGLIYRQKNRESAADLSAKKSMNQLNKMECTNAFTCEE